VNGDFEHLIRLLKQWADFAGHELLREPALAQQRPDFMAIDSAGRALVIEVKRGVVMEFVRPIEADVVPVLPHSTTQHWLDDLNVEHLLLLWATATKLLIARWEPGAAGPVIVSLDLLITYLMTRLVVPRRS